MFVVPLMIVTASTLLCLSHFSLSTTATPKSNADFVCKTNEPHFRVGFGSCNKQYKSQEWWERAARMTDLFIFHGDTVYARPQLSQLRHAYSVLESSPYYQQGRELLSRKLNCRSTATGEKIHHGIWSVWDDHDFGINDGGGVPFPYSANDGEERMKIFKDHLHPVCPVEGNEKQPCLAERDGVYHSIDIHTSGDNNSSSENVYKRVRLTLLDTRRHRQLYVVPSLGSAPIHFRLFPVIASLIRYLSAKMGLANHQPNAMLGEEQWNWFEDMLCGPSSQDIELHVIVSSIQITTKNGLIESWSHFPKELERLLGLLKTCPKKQFVLISGDVHFSEVMMTHDLKKPFEITSSGLTHNCASPLLPEFLCKYIVASASKQRHDFNRVETTSDSGEQRHNGNQKSNKLGPFFSTETAFGVLDLNNKNSVGTSDDFEHNKENKVAMVEFISTNMRKEAEDVVVWRKTFESFPTARDVFDVNDPFFFALELNEQRAILNRWLIALTGGVSMVIGILVIRTLLRKWWNCRNRRHQIPRARKLRKGD
eukprot:m.9730 g.9730  ORF g.9730 m.9730 type:complete len:539 (+) comp6402_c0_seq1:86-1702(+)